VIDVTRNGGLPAKQIAGGARVDSPDLALGREYCASRKARFLKMAKEREYINQFKALNFAANLLKSVGFL
jgi:hypothetical protein